MRTDRTMLILAAVLALTPRLPAQEAPSLQQLIYNPGRLKPVDSRLRVRVGERAPDFTLRAVKGGSVSLTHFRGKKNVLLSFVPAAFTPVCSAQWPGYHLVKDLFDQHDTALLGITTDNLPTLHAWTQEMGGVWFDVLSDFYPHGRVAARYGVLRSDGTAERALILVDKRGLIRWIDVHDINERPPLEELAAQLGKLPK
ncbi:MAG: redoxin domain-containing protein [Verrucomicrobia bacterium]|nr:redoxin domain-containing protein [Verrucomicrobiota bacterium]